MRVAERISSSGSLQPPPRIDLVEVTPFSIKSAQFLFDQGLDTIKIASGEITNIPLLEFIALKKWKIIL